MIIQSSESLKKSHKLRMFQGREYCFISNIDNLGATVDNKIMKLVLEPTSGPHEFVMEVTDKTRADVKVSQLIIFFFF